MNNQDQAIHELIDELIAREGHKELIRLRFNLAGRLPKELLHEETYKQLERIDNFLN